MPKTVALAAARHRGPGAKAPPPRRPMARRRRCRRSAALAVAILLALAPGPAATRPPDAAEASPAQARALLLRMADALAAAPAFSVQVDAGYDVMQPSGQKIEFGQTRRILLRRPDRLRISTTQRSGARQEVFYNGSELVLFDPRENVFARLPRPGSVDGMIRYLLGELRTPMPLSGLLLTTLPRDLGARASAVALVEGSMIAGAPVDHLVARLPDVDLQLWIRRGAQPVPLRLVLTYRDAPGQPQFRAAFTDWNFSPALTDADFSFVPPAGAEAVAVLVPAQRPPPAARQRN